MVRSGGKQMSNFNIKEKCYKKKQVKWQARFGKSWMEPKA